VRGRQGDLGSGDSRSSREQGGGEPGLLSAGSPLDRHTTGEIDGCIAGCWRATRTLEEITGRRFVQKPRTGASQTSGSRSERRTARTCFFLQPTQRK